MTDKSKFELALKGAVKQIDMESWPRRSQYDLFKGFASPHVGITAQVDVTNLMRAKQTHKVAPFNTMLYCIMTAINAVPELRTRFRDTPSASASSTGKKSRPGVIEHDRVHPSVTVPIEDDKFAFCEIPFDPDWNSFNKNCEEAIAAGKAQVELTENTADSDNWVFMSCLPWLNFTDMQHPLKGPNDCVPRIAWGKFTGGTTWGNTNDDNWHAPVNLTAHHALVDGLHIAKFFKNLEETTTNFTPHISPHISPA